MSEPAYTKKERKRLLKWLSRIEKKATAPTNFCDALLQAKLFDAESRIKEVVASVRERIEEPYI